MSKRTTAGIAPALIVASLAFPLKEARADLIAPRELAQAMAVPARGGVTLQALRSRDRDVLVRLSQRLRAEYPELLADSDTLYSRLVSNGVVFYRMEFHGLASAARAEILCRALQVGNCEIVVNAQPDAPVRASSDTEPADPAIGTRPFPVEMPRSEDLARAPNPRAAKIEARIRAELDPLGALPLARPDMGAAGSAPPVPHARTEFDRSRPTIPGGGPQARPMGRIAMTGPVRRPMDAAPPRVVARQFGPEHIPAPQARALEARDMAAADPVARAWTRAISRIVLELGRDALEATDADAARREIARHMDVAGGGGFAPGVAPDPVGADLARAADDIAPPRAGRALAARIAAASEPIISLPGLEAVTARDLEGLSRSLDVTAPVSDLKPAMRDAADEADDRVAAAGARGDTAQGSGVSSWGPVARAKAFGQLPQDAGPDLVGPVARGPALARLGRLEVEGSVVVAGSGAVERRDADTADHPAPLARRMASLAGTPQGAARPRADAESPRGRDDGDPGALAEDRAPAVAQAVDPVVSRIVTADIEIVAPTMSDREPVSAQVTAVRFDDRLVQAAAIDFSGQWRSGGLARMPLERPALTRNGDRQGSDGLVPWRTALSRGVDIAQVPTVTADDAGANDPRDSLLERLNAAPDAPTAEAPAGDDADGSADFMGELLGRTTPDGDTREGADRPQLAPAGGARDGAVSRPGIGDGGDGSDDAAAAPEVPARPQLAPVDEEGDRDASGSGAGESVGTAAPERIGEDPEEAGQAEAIELDPAGLADIAATLSNAEAAEAHTSERPQESDDRARSEILSVIGDIAQTRQTENARPRPPSVPDPVLSDDPATGAPAAETPAAQSRARAAQDLSRAAEAQAARMGRSSAAAAQGVNPHALRIDLSYVDRRDQVMARADRIKAYFPAMILAKGRMFGARDDTVRGRWIVGIVAHDFEDRRDIEWYLERMDIPYRIAAH